MARSAFGGSSTTKRFSFNRSASSNHLDMRAIRFTQHGDPLRVLALEDVATPTPGPGEVRVRLTHRPITPADLLTVTGYYRIFSTPPLAPGLEGVGVIDALGDGVQGLSVGQRVISLAGQPGHWAEQYVMPAERVLPIPDAIPDQVAARRARPAS